MEDPDDFVNNWRWVIEDTGPSYGPFTGMPGMNIPAKKSDPISYFELFFDPAMYTPELLVKLINMLTSDIKNFQVICHFLYTIITLLLLDNYITYHFLTKYSIITLLLLDNYMTYHFLTKYSIITLLLLDNYMTYHF